MEPPTLTPRPYNSRRLDRFLNSFWGRKLFNYARSTGRVRGRTLSNVPMQHTAEFKATSRASPAPSTFFHTEQPSQVLERLQEYQRDSTGHSILPVINQIRELSGKLGYEGPSKCERPAKRRRDLGTVQVVRAKYKKLQEERLAWMRQTRLKANQFPTSVQTEFHVTTGFKRDSPKRLALLQQFRSSSPEVYYGDSYNSKPAGVTGPRRVESEMPQHYHNTHAALFEEARPVRDRTRLERLSNLWHGGRDYDIISGTAVPIEQ